MKNPNAIAANFYGTDQTRFNLKGGSRMMVRRPRPRFVMGGAIKFGNIPKLKKTEKRNIYS